MRKALSVLCALLLLALPLGSLAERWRGADGRHLRNPG